MQIFKWDKDKNESLLMNRDISYEEIILAIYEEHIIDIYKHPDQTLYQGQKIIVVELNDKIYLVPFVETDNDIFLKTIIPSRKPIQK